MGDIIILFILIIATYLGYKKGFLRTLSGVIAILLSFVLALNFSTYVEDFIKSTPVYESIYENVEDSINPSNNEAEEYNTAKLNMPRGILKSIEAKKTETLNSVVEKICDTAVKIVAILIIFIAVRLLLWFLLSGFGIIKKLPLIGWFDKLLGALFGFLRGFLIVYLLLTVVTAFAAFNAENKIVKSINHSEFAKVMYNNNVFLDFVAKDWHKT